METQKELLELLRKIGTEEPLLCADEVELRLMFKEVHKSTWADFYFTTPLPKKQFIFFLQSFKKITGYHPKAVYFKLETLTDTRIETLENLSQIPLRVGMDVQCVFAYDRKKNFPDNIQSHLQVLIA